jgi:diguanylate cyclase (GGDEF)-like protein
MDRVLVVEDSTMIGKTLSATIEATLKMDVTWALTLKETCEILDSSENDFLAAVVDMNLPDAPEGEALEYVLSKQVPSIVFTGGFDDIHQNDIWEKGIVDYVLKNDYDNINYITTMIDRLKRNKKISVLVAEDSGFVREHVEKLLKIHNYNTFSVSNGKEALQLLNEHPEIKILITDFNMPEVGGIQLTKEIRKEFNKTELVIIGISSVEDSSLSACFIKNGANDFLYKPFTIEEFYCRLTQNVQTLERVELIKDISNRDSLTKLYSRQFFMDSAKHLVALSDKEEVVSALAIIDIDCLKKVNNQHGHAAGDYLIKELASLIFTYFGPSDLVARFSGEKICVLKNDIEIEDAWELFEELRECIEKKELCYQNEKFTSTVSVGICAGSSINFDEMLNIASEKLNEAKKSGSNRVVL